jgi:hypothetical protein
MGADSGFLFFDSKTTSESFFLEYETTVPSGRN